MGELLRYLLRVAQELASWIKTGEHSRLVLLGRDTHLLMGLLHELHGVHAQYFHWARVAQFDDMCDQWLREVPPGATVVDSGFRGTILDRIRWADKHVRACRMVATGGRYLPVLPDGDTDPVRRLVRDWEHFPKHHHRVVEYRQDMAIPGVSLPPEGAPVDEETAVRVSRELLREAGLSPAAADRWARFTGLSPEERIGPDYRRHFEEVAEQRRRCAAAPAPREVLRAVGQGRDAEYSDEFLTWYGERFAVDLAPALYWVVAVPDSELADRIRTCLPSAVPFDRAKRLVRWAIQMPSDDYSLWCRVVNGLHADDCW